MKYYQNWTRKFFGKTDLSTFFPKQKSPRFKYQGAQAHWGNF